MSQYHKATFIQNSLGKNSTRTHTLETDLLNLSNPEKSVVSAGKLFHMLTIRMLKKLRLLNVKYRCLCWVANVRTFACKFSIRLGHTATE